MGNASMLNGWRQFGLLAATFAAMLATAKLFSKSEAKHERQPRTPPGVGTQIIWPPQPDPVSSLAAPSPLVKREMPALAQATRNTDTHFS
jgi:hypothetical protein